MIQEKWVAVSEKIMLKQKVERDERFEEKVHPVLI